MIKNILILFLCFPVLTNAQQQITKTMIYDGVSREYIVYIPASYDASKDYPLLFSFHGGAGFANDFINVNDMRPIADTAAFIAIYPQGAIDYDGADPGTTPSTSWIHKAPTTHNDVNFIGAIIDTLANEYLVDENRVYACGYSEGGIFSYELGCRLNNRIAAFASVSGSMMVDAFRDSYYGLGFCSPIHPTAVMLIPGTNDFGPHSTYSGFQPYYMSADEITTYWSNYNNTDINPSIFQLPNINTSDGSTVEHRVWENGDNCSRVEELKVNGGGHDWPGTYGNMDIDATSEIWDFVSQFNINGLINCSSTFQNNLTNSSKRKLVKTIDILGRENSKNLNNLLLYIYDDGSIDKVFIVE